MTHLILTKSSQKPNCRASRTLALTDCHTIRLRSWSLVGIEQLDQSLLGSLPPIIL